MTACKLRFAPRLFEIVLPAQKAGGFVLYAKANADDSTLIPARLQSPIGTVVALADVTGTSGGDKPRIVCGAVKWHDVSRLNIYPVTESDLLKAPTVQGVK